MSISRETILKASPEELALLQEEVLLDVEQYACFEAVISQGKSVFITGPPACGKKMTVGCILRRLYYQKKQAVLTTTSSSRLRLWENFDVLTIHSFAGIGMGNEDKKTLAQRVPKERWIGANVWIVDGIDTLSIDLFEKLNYIGQYVRNCPGVLFGGIQMVFVGDFYHSFSSCFCFQSLEWKSVCPFFLKTVYRPHAILLSEIRDGVLTEETKRSLKNRNRTVMTFDLLSLLGAGVEEIPQSWPNTLPPLSQKYHILVSPIRPSVLMVTESASRQYNTDMLLTLDGDTHTYHAMFDAKNCSRPDQLYEYSMKGMNVERELKLKVGAQVMCIQTGRRGVVVSFSLPAVGEKRKDSAIFPIVQFEKGPAVKINTYTWKRNKIKVVQLPLTLAFSLSMSCTEGLQVSSLEINLRMFRPFQLYKALTRVSSLDHVTFTSVQEDSFDDLLPVDAVVDYYATFLQ
jgi:PIF1-like helicase